jgi:hypothetical protein
MRTGGEFMRKRIACLFAVLFLSSLLTGISAFAATSEVNVITIDNAIGRAAIVDGNVATAHKEAELEAYRNAILKGMSAIVYGVQGFEEAIKNDEVVSVAQNKIFRDIQGVVKDFKVNKEHTEEIFDPPTNVTYSYLVLDGNCKVSRTALDGALGPNIIHAMGNPRVMVLVEEHVGGGNPSTSAAEIAITETFENAGYQIASGTQGLPASVAYDDPRRWKDPTGRLKADVLIFGEASTNHALKQKISGASIYSVKAKVRLRAVLAETEAQITEKTVETPFFESTRPADIGAAKGLTRAATEASQSMINRVAYALAFGSRDGVPGVAVNIRVADVSFQEAQNITTSLQELAGRSGAVYDRAYRDGLMEVDMVSDKTAKQAAWLLSQIGIAITGYTPYSVGGRNQTEKSGVP